MGVVIPELRAKFRLLIAHGYFANLEEIAACFDRRKATIESWADGSAGRAPGFVPPESSAKVMEIFARCLVPGVTPERAQSIIFGPVSWMENQLKAGNPTSLAQLVTAEADRTACRLHLAKDHDTGLIETGDEAALARSAVPIQLNRFFRITIERDCRNLHVIALQNAPGAWGPVPHGIDGRTGHLLLPGWKANGELEWIKETRDCGLNRFITIATDAPIPADITHRRDQRQPFDNSDIDLLAHFYGQQPQKRRKLFMLIVNFVNH